ncbi:MAG: hypothetical protein F4Y02_01065 [Chloroflexi bacterium]|nr:hypothetical protein [Chloroflexota bacterium]
MLVALQARYADLGIPAIASVLLAWWGGYVIPSLARLSWPGTVPPLPLWLNGDVEGSLPNALSAVVLAFTALALGIRAGRAARWAKAGWALLAATALGAGISELTDHHNQVFEWVFHSWSIHLTLLAAGGAVGLGLWLWRGGHSPAVRGWLGLGCSMWVMALGHDAIYSFNLDRFGPLPLLIEESLEVTGALSLLLAAWRAESHGGSLAWHWPTVGGILGICGCALPIAGYLYQAPLVTTRDSGGGSFHVMVVADGRIRQDLPPIPGPSNRVDIRMALRGEAPTSVKVRVLDGETVISTGEARVAPQAENLAMQPFALATVLDTASEDLSLQVIADLPADAHLRIGARLRDPDGLRLQTNSDVHAGQRIEYTVFSTPEITRAKLAALGHAVRDGWDLATALFCWLSLVPLVAVPLLLAAARRRPARFPPRRPPHVHPPRGGRDSRLAAAIDSDAREARPGSDGLRNHGA